MLNFSKKKINKIVLILLQHSSKFLMVLHVPSCKGRASCFNTSPISHGDNVTSAKPEPGLGLAHLWIITGKRRSDVL